MSKPIQIELISIQYQSKTFGAAQVVVTVLGGNIPGYAVIAGTDKHITSRDYAIDWLIEQGLDGDLALDLICAAEGDQFALKVLNKLGE